MNSIDFATLLRSFPSSLPSSSPPGEAELVSVHQILPQYLGPPKTPESGKRTHGRGSPNNFDEIKKMQKKQG